MEGIIPEQVSGTKESRLSQNEIVKLKGMRQTEDCACCGPTWDCQPDCYTYTSQDRVALA